jgi:hypothetical protein
MSASSQEGSPSASLLSEWSRVGGGAFTGEKEHAVFGTEEVIEVGCGEAKDGLTFEDQWASPTWKRVACLAWKVTVRSFFARAF